jgi:serine/threonine protein kinase
MRRGERRGGAETPNGGRHHTTPLPERLNAPRALGGYLTEKELGRGAMGAVYLARQVSLDRPTALNVIQRRFAQNPIFVNRFVREAYAAAQLTHHNVVQIYDMGEEDGVHFVSMGFVRNRSPKCWQT